MSNRIVYSPRALHELDEIWEYIRYDLSNPSAADGIVNGIMDRVEMLLEYPESGSPLILDGGLETGYRYVVYEHYLAFYRLQDVNLNQTDEPGVVIMVDSIMYQGRDYARILFPELYSRRRAPGNNPCDWDRMGYFELTAQSAVCTRAVGALESRQW